jgi:hypothetical protein
MASAAPLDRSQATGFAPFFLALVSRLPRINGTIPDASLAVTRYVLPAATSRRTAACAAFLMA